MSTSFPGIANTDEQDALHAISRMLVGTKMLQDEPGVVYALQAQNARPQDAQAIDQFLQGLDAEKKFRIAQASGQKIMYTPQEKMQLSAMNIDFSPTEFTQQDATQAVANRILAESDGTVQAKRDANGNYIVGKDGQLETEPAGAALLQSTGDNQGNQGYGSGPLGLGPLWHTLHNDVIKPLARDVVDPATSVLSKGWNLLNTAFSDERSQATAGLDSGTAWVQSIHSRTQDMQAEGYNPNSVWSTLAFNSSGKAHTNTTDLAAKWDALHPNGLYGYSGDQAITEAEKYLNNPADYRKSIEGDPSNFTKVGTQTTLTPEGEQRLQWLHSADFANLVTEVNSRSATVGNTVANAIGIDPINHPTEYALASAGTNIAASFAVDPLLMLGKVVKAAKWEHVGINTLGDAQTAAKVLDPINSTGFFARQVQRGWQRAIDLAHIMRTGNETEAAAAAAKFHAELPGLAPMMDDFIGSHMLQDPSQWTEQIVNGERNLVPTFEAGPGIRSLADAATYVGERYGLTRLMAGRAATQSSLMPGALSALGYRKFKGLTAGWMSDRSAVRQLTAENKVLMAAYDDPGLAKKLVKSGDLLELSPSADNAANAINDNVIADKSILNAQHTAHVTLDALNQQLRDIQAFGKGDVTQAKEISGNLDNLEEQLQQLMSDKSASPEILADLHDKITEGRSLLQMAETNASKSKDAADRISTQGADLLDNQNPAQVGQQFGNFPTYKDANGVPGEADASYALSYIGKGNVAYNLRRTGNPLGEHVAGWGSPTAIAVRARLAAQRWTTLLPRNTMFNIDDAQTADKVYKYAMLYLGRGGANMLRAAYLNGDGGQRKAILNGLLDQVAHAAGLGMSETGQRILNSAKNVEEHYSSTGDEVLLYGIPVALHAGQVRQTWVFPTFQALQQASSKVGLWEATMGRALTSHQADTLMAQWKMGALFKPSTVTRNQLEGWGLTALKGHFGAAVKARAMLTTPNRELWNLGYAKDAKVEYDRLIADGKAKEAEQLARGNYLSGEFLGRSTPTQKLAEFAPLALAGRAYRQLVGRHMTDREIEAFLTLGKEELAESMYGYGQQMRTADLGERGASREMTEIARAGLGPAKIRYALQRAGLKGTRTVKSSRWTQQDTDGTVGADRFANALAMRVNPTPSVARAVIDQLKAESNGGTVDIQKIVDAMDDPAIANEMRRTSWGRVAWDNPNGLGPARDATSDVERELGKRIFAQKVLSDYRYLFTGQNQKLQTKLMDEVRLTGRAPTSKWITDNLKGAERPESVTAPETIALANGGVRGAIQALQDIEGAGYEWLVERPLLRTTSSPVFWANYAEARAGLNPMVDQLVEQGFSREAAGNLAKELSIRNSWVKTESLIDDPGQKSQFDVMARNMFPFSRATQAMIRRWGVAMWQDPTRARKLMLAYEGGVQSGFIYNNVYGEPTFTYPASGALNMVMREVAKIPGLEGLNQFPLSADMTGGVLMAVPGADNPFRMSMGPMLSIPLRELEGLMPGQKAMWDEVDSFINGPIGVGETWSQAVPTVARRFYQALSTDDRNSALASAMVGAIANLAAAGMIPPADASPSERDAFIQRVRTQVRSQLFLRAVFGLVAPAAPSAPSEGTSGSQSDYLFHVQGIGQLSDEYRQILNDVGGDVGRANAIWTAQHPDKTVYEVAHTKSVTSNAYLPATNSSLDWLTSHYDFVNKYKSVAAYFLPASTASGNFNDQAYQTQLELQLRQRKTPEEFYRDVRVKGAESVYYPVVAGFDKRIDAAKLAGNDQLASQWTQAKSQWEHKFKAQNPLFQQKIDSYPDARAVALGQLQDLERMLKLGEVPGGQQHLLYQLVTNYNNYAQFIAKHGGQTDAETAIRSTALGMFNKWVSEHVAGTELADLYAGVFRTLNTNLVDLNSVGG